VYDTVLIAHVFLQEYLKSAGVERREGEALNTAAAATQDMATAAAPAVAAATAALTPAAPLSAAQTAATATGTGVATPAIQPVRPTAEKTATSDAARRTQVKAAAVASTVKVAADTTDIKATTNTTTVIAAADTTAVKAAGVSKALKAAAVTTAIKAAADTTTVKGAVSDGAGKKRVVKKSVKSCDSSDSEWGKSVSAPIKNNQRSTERSAALSEKDTGFECPESADMVNGRDVDAELADTENEMANVIQSLLERKKNKKEVLQELQEVSKI